MNREGKKCVLYPRVSTEMQVDGYSLEGQKNGLKRFADREEMEISAFMRMQESRENLLRVALRLRKCFLILGMDWK